MMGMPMSTRVCTETKGERDTDFVQAKICIFFKFNFIFFCALLVDVCVL